MADKHVQIDEDLEEAIHVAEAALKVVKEKKQRAEEEAEEKRRAEEAETKRKAEEAETRRVAEEA
jgi:hypothetical protein